MAGKHLLDQFQPQEKHLFASVKTCGPQIQEIKKDYLSATRYKGE